MPGCNADTAQTGQSDKTGQGKADPDESAMQSGSDSDTENLEAEEQVNGARKERVLEGTGQPAVLSLSTAPDGCEACTPCPFLEHLHCLWTHYMLMLFLPALQLFPPISFIDCKLSQYAIILTVDHIFLCIKSAHHVLPFVNPCKHTRQVSRTLAADDGARAMNMKT